MSERIKPVSVFKSRPVEDQQMLLRREIRDTYSHLKENFWDNLKTYCSDGRAGLNERERLFEKYELDVVNTLCVRVDCDNTNEMANRFGDFLEWACTDPTVTEGTKEALRLLIKQYFSRADNVKETIFKRLSPLVEGDANEHETRPPTFAASLLDSVSPFWFYDRKYTPAVRKAHRLSEESYFFHTMSGLYRVAVHINTEGVGIARYKKSVQPYVRLYVLRRLIEERANGAYPGVEEFGGRMIGELYHTLEKNNRYANEQYHPLRATIGVELQYEGKKRLGYQKRAKDGTGVTRLSQRDMIQLAKYAGIENSGDAYYEFPLPPTYTATMQALMLGELERIQHLFVGYETPLEASAQPNLGGVRYEKKKHPQLQALQLILITAGYGFRQNEFSSKQERVTWGEIFPSDNDGKVTMVYQREAGDLEIKRMGSMRVVSEQRMPVIHSFAEGVRLFHYESDFSMLVKARQKMTRGMLLSPAEGQLAQLWDTFLATAMNIYAESGFDFARVIERPSHREKLGTRIAYELRKIRLGEEFVDGEVSLLHNLRQLIIDTRREALAIERMNTEG